MFWSVNSRVLFFCWLMHFVCMCRMIYLSLSVRIFAFVPPPTHLFLAALDTEQILLYLTLWDDYARVFVLGTYPQLWILNDLQLPLSCIKTKVDTTRFMLLCRSDLPFPPAVTILNFRFYFIYLFLVFPTSKSGSFFLCCSSNVHIEMIGKDFKKR